MAKNNLFLGTASGKVGDVVIYQRDGKQIARKYVSEVANPKTVGQCTQRNYLAPVMRFYSPLAGVLERSFEGLNKAKSTQRFNSLNVKLARSKGYYLPKGAEFFPLPYQLSRGTLQPLTTNVNETSNGRFELLLNAAVMPTDANDYTIAYLSKILVQMGYKEGDQLTIILIAKSEAGDYYPLWMRFNLSLADYTKLWQINNQIGAITSSANPPVLNFTVSESTASCVAGAAIISRYEGGVWRRSTQYLSVSDSVLSEITGSAAYKEAIDSYGTGNSINISEVYLNGGTTSATSGNAADGTLLATRMGNVVRAFGITDGNDTGVTDTDGVRHIGVGVDGISAANGTYMHYILFRSLISGTSNGKFLCYASGSTTDFEWVASSQSMPDAFDCFDITSANDPVAQWLISQGVPQSLFT